MTKFKIRKTRPSDYISVASLLKISKLASSWFTKKLFERLLRHNKGLYFVAEVGGVVVGTIFASEDGGYCGHLYKLAVASKYRRMGIGPKLIRVASSAVRKRGSGWVFTHVERKNKASLALLKSLGFGIRKTHYLLDNMSE